MKAKQIFIRVVGIIVTVALERIFSIIPFEKLFASEKWIWLLQNRFSLMDFIIFIVVLVIVFKCILWLESKKSERQKIRIEEQLKKINSFTDARIGIKVTWDMYMGELYDNDPHPRNIKIFCTKHNPPLLMESGYCTDTRCPNANKGFDQKKIENYIESLLLDKRDKLMKK